MQTAALAVHVDETRDGVASSGSVECLHEDREYSVVSLLALPRRPVLQTIENRANGA